MGDSVRESWQIWTITAVAALTVVLVVVNIVLVTSNRNVQAEVTARQQYVNQTLQLSNLNQQLVTAIANLAIRNNDEQLRNLLAEQGITVNPTPTPQAPAKAQR